MAQFYTGPDNTTQAASTYKNNIDNALDVHNRPAGGLQVAAESSPVMTVRYTAGSIQNGTTLTEVATGSTGTITAPSTNPRIDRVVVDNTTGVVSVITGAEGASPSAPAIASGKTALAQIALATSTTQITNSLITDERPGISVFATNDLADLDITGATAEASPDDADELAIYDDTAGANRKMTRANLLSAQPVGNIDVAGATDLGTAPADADEFLINDGGTNKKVNWSDLKSGISGNDLLQTITISNDATVDITSNITTTYDLYKIELINIVPATDATTLYARVSTSASFNSGATDYSWDLEQNDSAGAWNNTDNDGDTEIPLGLASMGSTGGESLCGNLFLFNPASATYHTLLQGKVVSYNAESQLERGTVDGAFRTAEANDGIQFLASSGNLTSGTIRIYGVK